MARTDWDDGELLTAAALNLLGEEINDLSARIGVLEGAAPGPRAVTITTTAATFSPEIELAAGSGATVHWAWSGGSTTGLTPTISFGSTGTRAVTMTALDGATDAIGDVETFNLGFDNTEDGWGPQVLSAGYNHTKQAVTAVSNVNAMTGLVRFLAACDNLTGTIDFTGMSALTHIECYRANLTGITLTGCTSLLRLNVEENNLATMDLNPVRTTLCDLRSAVMNGGVGLVLAPLTGNMTAVWHFCVRGQPVTNHPTVAQMPVLEELYSWDAGQSGTLNLSGRTTLRHVLVSGNSYSAVSGIAGATAMDFVNLNGNALDQADVDQIINDVEALGTSGSRTLIVTGTAPPSSAAAADITALTGRGWTVTTDAAATAPGTPTGLSGTPGNTQLSLAWTAPASNGGSAITSYTVRYRVTGGGAYTTITGVTSSPRVITGLTNSTVYNVSVAAVNAVGTGSYATDVNVTPTSSATVPGVPTGLSASAASTTSLGVNWTAPASDGGSTITSYTVRYRVTSVGGSYTTVTGISGTSTTITGLTAVQYDVSVAAVNAVGTGSYATDTTGTPGGVLWTDDFNRADAANLAAVGNGWSTPDSATAIITSNTFSKTSSGSYQRIINSATGSLPADHSVTFTESHASLNQTAHHYYVARHTGGTGVRFGWAGVNAITNTGAVVLGTSDTYNGGNITPTPDNAFPSSWTVNQDHTIRMQMVGTLINIYCDGVLVCHGTISTNAAATGTSFGIAGDSASTYNAISVSV